MSGEDVFLTDAAWYCRRDAEEERFYEILFSLCRKHHISWASANEEEKAHIEQLARAAYEQDRLTRNG